MSTVTRSNSNLIKESIAQYVLDVFDPNNVDGITVKPVVTIDITDQTSEPYVYFRSAAESEKWNNQDRESRLFDIDIEVVTKHLPGVGNQEICERIVGEVIELATTHPYADLTMQGWAILEVTTGDVIYDEFDELGARYFKATISLEVTATAITPVGQRQPSQASVFTFSGFTIAPVNSIEQWDSGTITGAPVANYVMSNGWSPTSVAYALASGADGSFNSVGNLYSVSQTDAVLALDTTINYQLSTDTSMTTMEVNNDTFPRVRSLRYGTVAGQGNNRPIFVDDGSGLVGLRNLPDFIAGNRTIVHGQQNVDNYQFTIDVNANEYIYIMVHENHPNLTEIEESVFRRNILNLFEAPVTIGGFKIYIKTDAEPIAGRYQYTLR